MKRLTSLSFITSADVDPETMPAVPKNPKFWEEHFRQVCSTRLSLALAKEKERFDADFSGSRERLRPRMMDQFKRLRDILNNPGVPPRKNPYPFTASTRFFREEVSRLISEKLH